MLSTSVGVLLILIAVGVVFGIRVPDVHLGHGLSALRIVSFVVSTVTVVGMYLLWNTTAVSTLDVAVHEMIRQIRGRVTKEAEFFFRQPILANALLYTAGERNDMGLTASLGVAAQQALDIQLLDILQAFGKVKHWVSQREGGSACPLTCTRHRLFFLFFVALYFPFSLLLVSPLPRSPQHWWGLVAAATSMA